MSFIEIKKRKQNIQWSGCFKKRENIMEEKLREQKIKITPPRKPSTTQRNHSRHKKPKNQQTLKRRGRN
jgi:hypothetical protein